MTNSHTISYKVPELFRREEDCCGCSACAAICPADAISMKKNAEGFAYPCIDEVLCIGCQLCIRVCPLKAASEALSPLSES